VPPVITIDGGPSVTTHDPTPTITGTSDVAPVTPVTPTLPLTPAPDCRSTFNAVATTAVTRSSSQTITGPTLSLGTKVTAPAAGCIVATASGTVKIGGIARAMSLTTATTALHTGRSATLRLILKGNKRAAKAASAKFKAVARTGTKVIATITIADAAGHTRIIKRRVTLT
jgi:hypothetical protein